MKTRFDGATKGPWRRGILLDTAITREYTPAQKARINKEEQRRVYAFFTANDEGRARVCITEVNGRYFDDAEYNANADLIEAAPSLLEELLANRALFELLETIMGPCPTQAFCSARIAAIDKLLGVEK